jgi:hypothetical protein
LLLNSQKWLWQKLENNCRKPIGAKYFQCPKLDQKYSSDFDWSRGALVICFPGSAWESTGLEAWLNCFRKFDPFCWPESAIQDVSRQSPGTSEVWQLFSQTLLVLVHYSRLGNRTGNRGSYLPIGANLMEFKHPGRFFCGIDYSHPSDQKYPLILLTELAHKFNFRM